MKPSITSNYFDMVDAYQMVKENIDAGFYQTEISECHYMPFIKKMQDVKEFRRYIDDMGFSIPQGHLIYESRGYNFKR